VHNRIDRVLVKQRLTAKILPGDWRLMKAVDNGSHFEGGGEHS